MRSKNTRIIVWILVFLMVISVVLPGCTATKNSDQASTEGESLKSGTYYAEYKGNNGPVKVEVVVADSVITSAVVISHSETESIASKAIETIPAKVVETQSLAIDAVAGATNSSNAIFAGIADCITQAGGDAEEWKTRTIADTSGQEIVKQADILIIGAGATGMTAAVSAAEDNAGSIIVLEKNAEIGGNAIISGGALIYPACEVTMRGASSEGQEKEIEELLALDFDDETVKGWQEKIREEYAEHMEKYPEYCFDSIYLAALQDYYNGSATGSPASTPDKILEVMEQLNHTASWLASLGVEWNTPVSIVGFPWPRRVSIKGYGQGTGFFCDI